MKFQAESFEGSNAIARHGPGGVIVGGIEFRHSVIVPWQGTVTRWDVPRFEALEPVHFEALVEWRPELVIFGSGARLRFPQPALIRALIDRRIGVETMDIAAACRTYNVLLGEGRAVIAALLFETL